MKKTLFLLPILWISNTFAQRFNEQNIRQHTGVLASDKFEGRSPGEKGEKLAAAYIAAQFKALHLQPKGDQGFFQSFNFKESLNPHDTLAGKIKRHGKNIVAFLDNGAMQTIVIGAHYDHLGKGNHGNSLDPNPKGKIHNGADDNASGDAAVMELARYYSTNNKKENCNFLFICFSAEECGLIGSKYFTNHPTIPLGSIKMMVNLDMVGRLNDSTKSLLIYGTGTSPAFEGMVHGLNKGFTLKLDSSGVGPSDHTSFYLKQIPVLFFFTGQHSDYHKPTDDADKINYSGEVKVLDFIADIVDSIDNTPRLTFATTRNSDQEKVSFKVTLGIMPDYAYDGKGLRIDGVTEGKPASRAGLRAGDVIIKLGEQSITDIQQYMKMLSKFNKGESTKVVVKRGKEEIELPVTF